MSRPVSSRLHLFPNPNQRDLAELVWEQAHSPKCVQHGRLHALCAGAELLELVECFLRFGCLWRTGPVLLYSLPFRSLFCYKEALQISQLEPLPAQESPLELKPTLQRYP